MYIDTIRTEINCFVSRYAKSVLPISHEIMSFYNFPYLNSQ